MPSFILDKSKVIFQYNKVKDACDVVSYSSKTNPIITGVLESAEECEGCMFSIHMKNELKNVKDKRRVMFLAQSWKFGDLRVLVEQGVRWFIVDNLRDLRVFEDFLNDRGDVSEDKLNLLLRMKLKENTLRTEKYFVFGLESEVVNRKLRELRGSTGIGKLGVHFHRKTQNMAEWNLKYEFEGSVGESVGLIDVVCIGGGLPAEYANTNVDVIDSVFRRINEFRVFLADKKIKMMIEPGRFIAAPAGKLRTKIIGVYDNTIVVNASVYNSDLDALVVPVKLKVEGELDKGQGKSYVVKGVTPCSLDLFRYRVYLPEDKVKEGEELVFLNAGAYNFGSEFCDLEKLETEVV